MMTTKEKFLGSTLRSAREAAGLTVDDAVYLAKIPRGVVTALEEQNFDFFSSPLYARSFLRQYGEYVGADVDIWMADLVPSAKIDCETVEAVIDWPQPAAPKLPDKNPRSAQGSLAAIWLLLITVGLFWGGLTIFKSFAQSPSDGSTVQSTVESRTSPEGIKGRQSELQTGNGAVVENEIPVRDFYVSNGTRAPEPPRRAIVVSLPE